MDEDPLALIQQKAAAQRGGSPPKQEEVKSAAPPADKHAICLQILTDGYVQSFVDFFYLTHKPEAAEPADDGGDDRFELPPEQLDFVKASLTQAEASRRQSETQEVYDSYRHLAELFSSMSDFKTSIYFREKCLEIAKLVDDRDGELLASRELGIAHEKLDNVPEAIRFYEMAAELTKGNAETAARANRDLVHAYEKYAKVLESSEELQDALQCHERAVKEAVDSADKGLIGTAHYHLGKCLERVKEPSQAIEHYKVYLELCRETGDNDGQGSAAFALASAYQQTGDIASAVTHLEAFIDLAQGTGQARTNLGIARGNLVMGAYVQVVANDLSALLKWKNRRAAFAEVAPRK
mmetsp:Transcript_6507/g.17694  ORF Transcript_6507/g.17694 Transcript_6507/m.17694 type:complete len:352 (+) Transcript_6507:39-1094(+)